MKNYSIWLFHIILSICSFHYSVQAQEFDPALTRVWEPIPRIVTPGDAGSPPSDAIILYDGQSTDAWEHKDGSPIEWINQNGMLTVVKGTGEIFTKDSFGDCQLHVEWRAPAKIEDEGQGRGNSGIFLQSKYEVQVLDSYNNQTYSNGQAGAIYKQHIPLVNAMKPPGQWNSYDIIFKAPIFNSDGIKTSPGYITVLHNGVLIQNHALIFGSTEDRTMPKNIAHGEAPLRLQDHDNPVSYRNIWIRKL